MDPASDVRPISNLQTQAAEFVRHIQTTGRPMILTVDGKASAVLQDFAAYQRLLDIAAEANEAEGIRQGLNDLANGRTLPARDVFGEIRAEYDIPR